MVSIFIFIAIVGGVSYAFFNYNKSIGNVTLNTGEISINLANINGNLSLLNSVPKSDNEGKVQGNYLDFEVTSTVDSEPIYYEVYILPKSGNTLDTSYIKTYLTDQSNNVIKGVKSYNSLQNSEKENGKLLYKGLIKVNNDYSTKTETKDFRLRLWLDESYTDTNSNTFNFDINLYAYNVEEDFEIPTGANLVRKAINDKINAETNSCNPIWVDNMDTANDETDDITYFSGTNDCVDMNYVWYSGKLWRIVAIYPDGTMKLITENNITSMSFNASGQPNLYINDNTKSYMYDWLNEDFYDTLYNVEEILDTTHLWNASNTDSANENNLEVRIPETTMVSSKVGLLNIYEYYNSYRCIGSDTCTGKNYGTVFLNNGYYWWLLNPYGSTYIWDVNYNGYNYHGSPSATRSARPVIVIKSDVEFIGNGTEDEPFRIIGDKISGNVNDLINTRLSGEYVLLKNGNNESLFRIINVENNKTKLISMNYADNNGIHKFATGNSSGDGTIYGSGQTITTGESTWYNFLTETYYSNLENTYGQLFDSNTYYLGTVNGSYKLSVCTNATSGSIKECTKTSQVGTFMVGLPRYGEIFATQESNGYTNSIDMWLLNRYSSSKVWCIGGIGYGDNDDPTHEYGARPTIHLKPSVKILSGSGTESDPYIVGL